MSPATSDALLDIAIIGIAGKFPQSPDPETLWKHLRAGKELLTHFSEAELAAAGVPESVYRRPDYVRVGAVLDDVDCFDAEFFGYSPREATLMDPQHRLFVECAWAALENAGYPPIGHPGRIGVYASSSVNYYMYFGLQEAEPDLVKKTGGYQFAIGSEKDYVATRVSYLLDLRGPSINIQTACSSSLVAVHYACQGLLNGECDLALAGAATVRVPHRVGYQVHEGTTARDGHCRTFDAQASGTIFGSGVGIVVLKRLEDALADRDSIYAVIKGTAINNDGRSKVGFTAPSIEGQAAVISDALLMAGVAPETISYVEAHGTATPLGDPIEIAGLVKALSKGGPRKKSCALGAVKSNLGHLEGAAGVTGLIKTALALHHKELPPSLHFETANPDIDFSSGLLHVNTRLTPWETDGSPRRAGVSSFGIGGTNAHAILEEAPAMPASQTRRTVELLVMSARTPAALDRGKQRLAQHLEDHADLALADIAYTLQVGRTPLSYRAAVACRTREEAIVTLRGQSGRGSALGGPVAGARSVAFAFPGGGTQYAHMARELRDTQPRFRESLDQCAEILIRHLDHDIRRSLYPEQRGDKAEAALSNPDIALPALFAVEYALARLWMSWGVQPSALIGHSFGEYVAACLAGVFSLEDALALVARRGQLLARLPPGAMLGIAAAPRELEGLLPAQVGISLINAPGLCVASGPVDPIDELARRLDARGIKHRRVHFGAAMHCPLVDPIIPEFVRFVQSLALRAPQIPYISNVTGTWITAAQATDPHYWARHMRETVRFSDGLATLFASDRHALVEVGPGQAICSFARQQLREPADHVLVHSLPHAQDEVSDQEALLTAAGKLWVSGVAVDWAAFHDGEQLRRAPLPTYAFERTRFWVDIQAGTAQNATLQRAEPRRAGKREDLADWFYVSSWKRTLLPRTDERGLPRGTLCLLLVDDAQPIASALVEHLIGQGYRVACARPGTGFAQLDTLQWTIDPRQPRDYEALLRALRDAAGMPQVVAHLWTLSATDTRTEPAIQTFDDFDRAQQRGLYSLLFLAQALVSEGDQQAVRLCLVSNEVRQVTGRESLRPEHATLFASGKVISQEYLHIRSRTVDLGLAQDLTSRQSQLVQQLARELTGEASELAAAYREGHRWVEEHVPVRIEAVEPARLPLRTRGTYLITGGYGNVGLDLAEYLARTRQARLVLTGRRSFPPREQWASHAAGQDPLSPVIRRLMRIEELGGEIMLIQADVTDGVQMEAAVRRAVERFGPLHGVIHAAGHVGESSGKLLREFDEQTCRYELASKVHGALLLDRLCQNQELDFRLFVSSVSTVLGGLGHFAYTAANTFLDVFAQRSESAGRPGWMSWGSELWNNAAGHDRTSVADYAMTSAEGVETFARVLSCEGARHVVVSSGSLEDRVARWVRLESARQALRTAAAELHERPAISAPYAAPTSEIEIRIAEIWSQHLGTRSIGVHDDFFELGGHSLLATQIVAQIREELQVDVSMRLLFQSPTVAELARAVEHVLLAELETLSDDEAQALLDRDERTAER